MRAALYVDGFNLYHAVDALKDQRLKWLSLHSLGESIIRRKTETLSQVVYFSAYANFLAVQRPAVLSRHRCYVAALRSTGVEIILGNFKEKTVRCHRCNSTWMGHEEKETDVNIAVRLVSDAFRDNFDMAYVLSADTDLVPALKCARTVVGASGRAKEIVAVFPPMQNRNTKALVQNSDRHISLNAGHIANSRLPNSITLASGNIITCPPKYL